MDIVWKYHGYTMDLVMQLQISKYGFHKFSPHIHILLHIRMLPSYIRMLPSRPSVRILPSHPSVRTRVLN
jgi:hypothetical protein